MGTRVAWILILLGFLTLTGQIVHRLQRDKAFYSEQLQAQQTSIEEGLKARWSDYLLLKARDGKIKPSYSLRISRDGQTLREKFFPAGSTLDWKVYRDAKAIRSKPEQVQFLKVAMQNKDSWDRVLAIEEWKNVSTDALPVQLSAYEFTRISEEARNAYALIFELLDSRSDFSLTTAKVEFEKAFFRAVGDGDIEIFVPSVKSLEPLAADFINETAVNDLIFKGSPWEVSFLRKQSHIGKNRTTDAIFLVTSAICFTFGLGIYLRNVRLEKQKLSSQVSFLNQVVHELKTPLTGLKLHTQLMRNYGPSPDSLEGLELSVNRMNQLFDDITAINQPLAKVELELVPRSALNELVAGIRRDAGEKTSLRGQFVRDLVTDRARLNLILRNLVRNAIKYGEFAEITIDQSQPFTLIEVKDRGDGIPVSEAEKIFQEFYRSEAGRRKTADGLGLGLSLAKKLATEIGIELKLLNPGEKNARFQLHIPGKPR